VREVRRQEPNEDLIKNLEDQLEKAKKGEIQGMVSISIWEDGSTCNGWVNPPKAYQTKIVSRRMIGELEYLKLDLMSAGRWVEREELFG